MLFRSVSQSRYSVITASAIFIIVLSMVQTVAIVSVSGFMGAGFPSISGLAVMALILILLIVDFTMLSLGLAFAMPGHQEMLAFIFLVNLQADFLHRTYFIKEDFIHSHSIHGPIFA